jgi:DNA repair protein RAD5
MSLQELEERPVKKRRFFVEDLPDDSSSLYLEPRLSSEETALSETASGAISTGIDKESVARSQNYEEKTSEVHHTTTNKLDTELFASILGRNVPASTIRKLDELSGGNVEQGISTSCRR